MKLLDPTRHAHVGALTDILDALALSADPCSYLPALLIHPGEASASRAFLEITTESCAAPSFQIRRLVLPGEAPTGPVLREPCAGGQIGELFRVPIPKLIHEATIDATTGLPPSLHHYRSLMAIPIHTGPATFDWILLLDARPDGFTIQELEETILRARLVAITIENLHIAQRLCASNIRIRQAIDEIAEIQRTLLPDDVPEIPGLKLAASYDAVSAAGGDFYDFIPLGRRPGHPECEGDQRWAILIGDVSGHGPAAACVMAMFHAIVHAFPHCPSNPAQVLGYANRHLWTKRMKGAFVTALLAFYDPASRKLTYCRAGHPPALLTSWSGPIPQHTHLDDIGDLPLGIDPDLQFHSGEIKLEPGQTLLLYTDGITEAQNESGTLLEAKGLETAIAAAGPDPDRIMASIVGTVEWHTRGEPTGDDRTLIVLHAV